VLLRGFEGAIGQLGPKQEVKMYEKLHQNAANILLCTWSFAVECPLNYPGNASTTTIRFEAWPHLSSHLPACQMTDGRVLSTTYPDPNLANICCFSVHRAVLVSAS